MESRWNRLTDTGEVARWDKKNKCWVLITIHDIRKMEAVIEAARIVAAEYPEIAIAEDLDKTLKELEEFY